MELHTKGIAAAMPFLYFVQRSAELPRVRLETRMPPPTPGGKVIRVDPPKPRRWPAPRYIIADGLITIVLLTFLWRAGRRRRAGGVVEQG